MGGWPDPDLFHEDKAQTICLLEVTSKTCRVPGQCEVSLSPAIQEHITVLPLARRWAVCVFPSL